MNILKADYVGSFHKLRDCPKDKIPGFAFIGRSNVGKSSLINMITGKKQLAKISGAPGKTQSINFFEIESKYEGVRYRWHLIDLPGYGYAKRSKKDRQVFQHMINDILLEHPSLACVFQLIDINVPPQKSDLENINWLGEHEVPFVLAFTKCDRQSQLKNNESISKLQDEMLKKWDQLPRFFLTSAVKHRGGDDILEFISVTIKQLKG